MPVTSAFSLECSFSCAISDAIGNTVNGSTSLDGSGIGESDAKLEPSIV